MLVAVDVDGTIDADPATFGSLMQALTAAGHRVAVLTGASGKKVTPDEVAAKADYLNELGVGHCYDRLVVFGDPPHKAKAKWCRKHGVSLLIDNSTKTAPLAAKVTTVLVPWASADPAAKELPGDAALRVVKAVDERRYTLGLAYPANRPDVGKAADGHRDFVSAETLEDCAWSFMRKGAPVGLHHADGTEGHGTVVESYIYRAAPWKVKDTVIKAGDWLLGVVWDRPTWPLIKSGRLNGFSPQGFASRSLPSAEALAKLRED